MVIAPGSDGAGKKLTWWQLALITFVFTSAGPFGMESSVRAAGPLYTIALIFAVPIFHVLPMILIVTEMSSWMPTNHGSVLWIARAYGPVVGFVSAIMQMFISIVDISVYPVLLVNYLAAAFFPTAGPTALYAMVVVAVVVGSAPAFLHVGDMGRVSGVVLALICIPFVIGVAFELPRCDPSVWWATKRTTVDVGASWSTGIWMYTGFMALGALGAEVEHHSVFLLGCSAAALLDIVMYLLPLLVALQVPGNWADGFLVYAFGQLIPGLNYAVSIAGALSGFGLYTSSIACFSRTIWGIADRGWLPRVFTATSHRTGAPYAACILLVCTSALLGLFEFDFLVALLLVISACNFCLFYTTFLLLRYREPYAYRPYRIPGGKLGAWLLVSPIVVVYFTLFVATVQSDVVIDAALVVMLIVLLLLYFTVVRPGAAAGPDSVMVFHDVAEPDAYRERRIAAQQMAAAAVGRDEAAAAVRFDGTDVDVDVRGTMRNMGGSAGEAEDARLILREDEEELRHDVVTTSSPRASCPPSS